MKEYLSTQGAAARKGVPAITIKTAVKFGRLVPDVVLRDADGGVRAYGFLPATIDAWELQTRYTAAQKKKAVDMVAAGATYSAAGRAVGTNHETVRRWARVNG